MSFIKEKLGIISLEERLEILEEKVSNYEVTIKILIDALNAQAVSVISLSEDVEKVVEAIKNGQKRINKKTEQEFFH